MRASWIAVLLLAACSSGPSDPSDPKPRTKWVNEERIDVKTWGAPCGPLRSVLPPGTAERKMETRRWSNGNTGPRDGRPFTSCSLTYNTRTGQPMRLEISLTYPAALDRSHADELL